MQQLTIIRLTEKYATGTISTEENQQFIDWLKQVEPDEFYKVLNSCSNIPEEFKNLPKVTDLFIRSLEQRINKTDGTLSLNIGETEILHINEKSPSLISSIRKWQIVTAAAVLCAIATLTYFFREAIFSESKSEAQLVIASGEDLLAGGNRAVLTLADGSRIVLDSAVNGAIGQQGNSKIVKLKAGQLSYNAYATANNNSLNEILYNTISTPKGGQYQIELSDGSKVWLNAASSLRFPTVFQGKKRTVEVKGEAYFEIKAQNDPVNHHKIPFSVNTAGMDIDVLGTSFNVNAYTEEEITKTTLVEGSVKVFIYSDKKTSLLIPDLESPVKRNGQDFILKPGQQASTNPEHYVSFVNLDTETAWKNGFFKFSDSPIEPIMRQLARWYNLEVTYEGKIGKRFRVNIPRDLPVSQVLKALEKTDDVHFLITGNKVSVMP